MGLVIALQVFLSEDEEAETEHYRQMSQAVVDALIEIPGIEVTVTHDEYNYLIPMALISFTSAWNGPSRDVVNDRMGLGDPPVYLHTLGDPDVLAVDPINLDDGELETVIRRLREELLGQD